MQDNFIAKIIKKDLEDAGLKLKTRFPPEPNGYLHIGHAKSIILNFGLAEEFNGTCHLRFDDTDPSKEYSPYIQPIKDSIKWLGYGNTNPCYYTSDYFEKFYYYAQLFIKHNLAYVDDSSREKIKEEKGYIKNTGVNSVYRDLNNRSIDDNLQRFEDMRMGKIAESLSVLRLKIDMSSPNLLMRDPIIYRIRHMPHHRHHDKWCIYPTYDYTHCISDALENITHSICTLEFENNRPLYNWILNKLSEFGELKQILPKQIEFSRLNIENCVTSKRNITKLISSSIVDGWDDPRLATISGLKCRGYSPEGIKIFCNKIGITKDLAVLKYEYLEECLRYDLNKRAIRAIAIINPIKITITNHINDEICVIDDRELIWSKELYISSSDFLICPSPNFKRLSIGNKIRLKYAYTIVCSKVIKDAYGNITELLCEYFPDTKSGTEGSNNYKVDSTITWISKKSAVPAVINTYDHIYKDAGFNELNPNSLISYENSLVEKSAIYYKNKYIQFERLGYAVLDSIKNKLPIFNISTRLKSRKLNTI